MDNGITYREENDYFIPNIALSYDTIPLGYYGMLRKDFLKEHRKITYSLLLGQELLYPHCLEIELQVKAYMTEIVENMPVGYSENEIRRLAHGHIMDTLISSDWRRPRPTQNCVR